MDLIFNWCLIKFYKSEKQPVKAAFLFKNWLLKTIYLKLFSW